MNLGGTRTMILPRAYFSVLNNQNALSRSFSIQGAVPNRKLELKKGTRGRLAKASYDHELRKRIDTILSPPSVCHILMQW